MTVQASLQHRTIFSVFIVADMQLYQRLCLSVCPSVRQSIRPSVHLSIRQSVMHKSKIAFLCLCVVVGGMGCGWGLDASAHPSATLNALWDFFSSPRVSELSLDSLRARDWELSQDLRAIFGLSESCKTLCKLDSSQRVWELFLLSEIVKALTAFRELYLNLEIISCLQESLVIVFCLEHAIYELAASVCPCLLVPFTK